MNIARLTKVAIGEFVRNSHGYGKKEYSPMAAIDFFIKTLVYHHELKKN